MFLFVNLNVTLFRADMYFFTCDNIYATVRIYGTAVSSICSSVCYTRGFYQNGSTYHRNSFTLW